MINEPPVDKLLEQLGTEDSPASRYALCVVAAKRARQIMETNAIRESGKKVKEISMACDEIAEGKVKLNRD